MCFQFYFKSTEENTAIPRLQQLIMDDVQNEKFKEFFRNVEYDLRLEYKITELKGILKTF